jgi:CheY-like chemotaxis protein
VVVIEDEPDILALLRDLLEMEGFRVVSVKDPHVLESSVASVEPDLFLVDIMLQGTSGIEVAERLRGSGFGDTPMIAMSASQLMRRLASESGLFQEALDKPFDIPVLLECVER